MNIIESSNSRAVSINDLDNVSGGVIFGPILLAYSWGGAKAAVMTGGFMAGMAWEAYQQMAED